MFAARTLPKTTEPAAPPAGPGRAAADEPRGRALPLVLDLDGTLLRSDLLLECIAARLRARPLDLFRIVVWGLRGRAHLKQRLAETTDLDVSALPLNERLVSYAAREAARGRKVHLATAADHRLAARIAARLPFIRRVFASDGRTNLKGARKAQVLAAAFPEGFVYAGNDRADLPVWSAASGAVIVEAPPGVARQAARLHTPELVIARPAGGLRLAARVLRLHQWAKNALVFAPLMLGGLLLDPAAWTRAGAGFLALSLVASATYLLNDLLDLEDDRRHWSKRNRPLASGDLSIATALALIPAGLAAGFAIAAFLGPVAVAFLAAYLAVTLAYSWRLKRIELLDTAVLAGLFTLRLGFGAVLAGVALSPWLLVFCMFLFLSLSFAKRHVEVTRLAARGRAQAAGRGYRAADAPILAMIGVASGLAAVQVMVMYVMSEGYRAGPYAAPVLLWAVPPILFLWIARIWLLAQRGELDDDPVAFAVKDPPSLLLGAVLGMVFLAALVGPVL